MVSVLSRETEKRQNMRVKLVMKLLPIVRKEGIASLRTDRIAKIMDVSKATMYKYFSSKEDIIDCIVDLYVQYIQDVDEVIVHPDPTISERFQVSYQQSVLIAFYISETFLSELQVYSADLYEKIVAAQELRNERLTAFYNQFANKGIFNKVNPALIHLQDALLLRRMFDPTTLVSMNLTLFQALYDYYLLKKQQLIHADYLEQIDDQRMQDILKKLVLKFSGAI